MVMLYYFSLIHLDYPNVMVIWTKRGVRFSQRAYEIPTESHNSSILYINNFQSEDLGIYVCRVKAVDDSSLSGLVRGEAEYYLMASELGFRKAEQFLLGPDVVIKTSCDAEHDNPCLRQIAYGKTVELSCETKYFGKFFCSILIINLNSNKIPI